MAVSENQAKVRRAINRDQTLPLSQKRVLRQVTGDIYNAVDASQTFVEQNTGLNQLLAGSSSWVSGLTFAITETSYIIDGKFYQAYPGQVTLGAADATHPRIDVIYVDVDGNLGVLEGTAAASPVKPELDFYTQVEITFATIAALATAPSDVSNLVIYDEDDNWTTAVSNARIVKAATVAPNGGTKHIHFNDAQNGDYITLTDGSVTLGSVSSYSSIQLYVRAPNGRLTGRNSLMVALYNGTTRVSDRLLIKEGSYGFQGLDGQYEIVTIPMAAFNLTGKFTVLRITFAGKGTIQAYVDDISAQQGVPDSGGTGNWASLDVSNVFTKAQGSGITTLTDGATIAWDASPSNVYQVTLDGNRTMGAPTNVQPGFTYILFVIQDDTTGSRTITWNAVFKWAGGTAPTLSTAVDSVDVITFIADASGNLHGSLGIADSQ